MLMDSTHYLPSELLTYKNFPEVQQCMTQIQQLQAYGLIVNDALLAYTNGMADKVDVNLNELSNNINQCRDICSTLGNASNICYDALLPLRELQKSMQILSYYRSTYGSKYVGKPSSSQLGGI